MKTVISGVYKWKKNYGSTNFLVKSCVGFPFLPLILHLSFILQRLNSLLTYKYPLQSTICKKISSDPLPLRNLHRTRPVLLQTSFNLILKSWGFSSSYSSKYSSRLLLTNIYSIFFEVTTKLYLFVGIIYRFIQDQRERTLCSSAPGDWGRVFPILWIPLPYSPWTRGGSYLQFKSSHPTVLGFLEGGGVSPTILSPHLRRLRMVWQDFSPYIL